MPLGGESLPAHNANENGHLVLDRAGELEDLLNAVQKLILPFIRSADDDAGAKQSGHGLSVPGGGPRTSLVEYHKPEKLVKLLDFQLPDEEGRGKDGLLEVIEKVLKYSVNTWDQGFLDKLYSSTDAVGVISELILAVLNTNLHVYQVSPALTIIEKTTAKALAQLFGFNGPHAGGISTQGGSASNTTALVVARNTLFPMTKTLGNGERRLVLFTSAHGHYSFEKAAQMMGLGSNAVIPIGVDSTGRMVPSLLSSAIQTSIDQGQTPFFVNATAGTTVLGSYDPFPAIAQICSQYRLWLHIDGSWGGPVIFSSKHRPKMQGSHFADSIAINPHKMLHVPVTCSFLLTRDLTLFHCANTLPAGYLFHATSDDSQVWDLADLTLQCGRRADSLKLALSWIYHGSGGFERAIDGAFEVAAYLAELVDGNEALELVGERPLPCLQVCFYWVGSRTVAAGEAGERTSEENTAATRGIAQALLVRGFMVDYAPGESGQFFRVVINTQTRRETVEGLVKAIVELGAEL